MSGFELRPMAPEDRSQVAELIYCSIKFSYAESRARLALSLRDQGLMP